MDERDADFCFDDWAALARDDPEAFESARRAVIDSLIERAPEATRRRLRGLQWQVDQMRTRAGSSLASCMRVSALMWNSVLGPEGLVDGLEQLSGAKPVRKPATRAADILPFRGR
jgi:hypothetical protein